jgi:hypothetical protein
LWCEGRVNINGEELFDLSWDGFVVRYSSTLVSRSPDSRCEVAYTINSELITSDYTGVEFPPLSQLHVEEITVEEDTGRYWITVQNAPTASWAGHDLRVQLTRNSGEEILSFTRPELWLNPGDAVRINDPDMPSIERPKDLCVTLDPENVVLESVERANPGWTAPPYCLEIPDLAITNAGFADDDRTLVVIVQNRGSGPLEAATVDIDVFDRRSGGTTTSFSADVGALGLLPWETTSFRLPLSDEPLRSRSRINYTINLDPLDVITETDEENNAFSFEEGFDTFEIWWDGFDYGRYERGASGYTWTGLYVPWFEIGEDTISNHNWFMATVYIDNGISLNQVGRMEVDCLIRREYRGQDQTPRCQTIGTGGIHPIEEPYDHLSFRLANGEGVSVQMRGFMLPIDEDGSIAERPWNRLGTFWLYFDFPSPDGPDNWCGDNRQPYGERKWGGIYSPYSVHPWYAGFTLCRAEP